MKWWRQGRANQELEEEIAAHLAIGSGSGSTPANTGLAW
jgi:hypothetical protein